MAGVTLDSEDLSDESPTDEPIRLKAVVDFHGPIDIGKMNFEPSTQDHGDAKSPEGMFLGGFNVLGNPDKCEADGSDCLSRQSQGDSAFPNHPRKQRPPRALRSKCNVL